MFTLKFESGTLILEGAGENASVPRAFVWDTRTRHFRAPAYLYREIIKEFIRAKTPYEDEAKNYAAFDFKQKYHIEPRPFQTASIEAWRASGAQNSAEPRRRHGARPWTSLPRSRAYGCTRWSQAVSAYSASDGLAPRAGPVNDAAAALRIA